MKNSINNQLNKAFKISAIGFAFGFTAISANAQISHGFGTTTPNRFAIVDMGGNAGNTQGFLAPRVNGHATITGLGATEKGLTVFDTSDNSYWYWNGLAWIQIGASGSGIASINAIGVSSQFLKVSTSGTTLGWNSVSPDHTLNIPLASIGTTVGGGLITNAEFNSFLKATQLKGSKSINITNNQLFVNIDAAIFDTTSNLTIVDGGIKTAKIADANVTTAKIADANVTEVKLANDAVSTRTIVDGNVTTAKIADANVTKLKLSATGGAAGNVLKIDAAGTGLEWGTGTGTTYVGKSGVLVTANVISANVDNITIDTLASGSKIQVKALGIGTAQLATDAVETVKIKDGAVTTSKILGGGNDMVLTTDGSNIVTWLAKSSFAGSSYTAKNGIFINASKGISVNVDDVTLDSSAAQLKVKALGIGTAHLASEAVTFAKLSKSPLGPALNNTTDKNKSINWNGTAWELSAPKVGADNGLTVNTTTGNVELGGILTKSDTLTTAVNKDIFIDGAGKVDMDVDLSASGMVLASSSFNTTVCNYSTTNKSINKISVYIPKGTKTVRVSASGYTTGGTASDVTFDIAAQTATVSITGTSESVFTTTNTINVSAVGSGWKTLDILSKAPNATEGIVVTGYNLSIID